MNKKSSKKKVAKRRKIIGKLKEAASVFLTSEEGKIVKRDIIKTAIALGLVAGAAGNAAAQHADVGHADCTDHVLHNDGATGAHNSSHGDAAHADHADHSSHDSGGWC